MVADAHIWKYDSIGTYPYIIANNYLSCGHSLFVNTFVCLAEIMVQGCHRDSLG